MSISESIRLALASLSVNKLRAALTLLGIIIGITSVIGILTIGNALQASAEKNLSGLGNSDLTIEVQSRPEESDEVKENDLFNYTYAPGNPDAYLTEDDVADIRQRFGSRLAGIPLSADYYPSGTVTAVDLPSGDSLTSTLMGVNEDYGRLNSITVGAGREITSTDVESGASVAVVSPNLVDKLFDGNTRAALGQTISFEYQGDSTNLQIIGVFENGDSQGLLSGMSPELMLSPYSALSDLSGVAEPTFSSVSVRPASQDDAPALKEDLTKYLDRLYADDAENYARITDNSKAMDQINKILSAITLAISAISGISLLVGGIGVMNIMLVSVTERTREIGIRKALGARPRDIKVQFLIEAMIVCLIGGLTGLVLGGIIGYVASAALFSGSLPPLGAVAFAVGFSVAIGVFFGYYPASRAARLNPIEALRYE
ncbi:MAG: ABC transporter permease [Corynebacterium sp.]|nr:ABC transporter permease [Corynebacterium sp.]